jgi:O-antigen/teichoic acid export membrane protein
MFWMTIAAGLARGLPILGMLMAARILGREAFGQLSIVYTTVLLLQVFAVAGLGITATTFIARWRHADPTRAGRIIGLSYGVAALTGGLFFIGFLASAHFIADVVLATVDLASDLRVGAGVLLAVTINAVQTGILTGLEAYRGMAAANLVGGIASALLLALGAQLGGVAGALYGLFVAAAVQGLLSYRLIRRAMRADGIRATLRPTREELRLLWRFSLPDLLTIALWTGPTWAASAMLVRQPGGLAEMGLLAAANQWFVALMFLPRVLTQVLLPVYARRLADEHPATTVPLAVGSAHVVAVGITPVIALLAVFSPWIAALYGPGFVGHADVFVYLLIAAGVAAPQGALTNYLVARQHMWIRFAINALWAALLLIGSALLIDRGALGIATATLVAYAVRTLLTYAYVRHLARL